MEEMMKMNIGFIGGGNMSTAIFKGILKRHHEKSLNTWVAGPHLENLKHWKELGASITTNNGELLSTCDIIFLGVKPGILHIAVAGCFETCPAHELIKNRNIIFVSMLVGINLEQLHKALKVLPVQSSVIRILPNTPMAVGAGSCLYTPDSSISVEQCSMLENLLRGCGICEKIPESLMDSLGALTGCGPAFIYIIIEALADGAVKQGVPRALAIKHAAQVVSGSGQMVIESGKHPGLLKDEVCSPGGTTICGVTALENGKLRATLIGAIEAAVRRTKEIGNK